MSSRMAPQYCPYCGEQDLRPIETDGQWECRDCIRVFGVRFVGIAAHALASSHQDDSRLGGAQDG